MHYTNKLTGNAKINYWHEKFNNSASFYLKPVETVMLLNNMFLKHTLHMDRYTSDSIIYMVDYNRAAGVILYNHPFHFKKR